MDNDNPEALLRHNRRRVLLLGILPVLAVMLAVFLLGIWRYNSGDVNNTDGPQAFEQITQLTIEQLESLPDGSSITINRANQLVINGQLTANQAITIVPGSQPQNPDIGTIYYDEVQNSLNYFDGDQFVSLASVVGDLEICYIGQDCGFLTSADLPDDISLPVAVNVTNLTDNGVLLGNGSGPIQATAAPVGGQVLVGSSGGVPIFKTISGDISLTASGATNLGSNTVGSGELVASGVTAGTYGNGSDYPIFTVDSDGRITSASTLALPGGGGGVTALNSLTGALDLNGTANQIIVNSGGSTITLSTPQDIAVASSPTFTGLSLTANLIVNGASTLGDGLADAVMVNGTIQGGSPFVFEGTVADAFETTFVINNPTTDNSISFPNISGEVSLLGQTIDDLEVSDSITIGPLGSVDDNALSANVSLLGPSIDGSEISDGTVANIDLANSSITITAGLGLSGGGLVSLGGSVSLQNAFGASIDSVEITDGTISLIDIGQNGCSGGDVLEWNGAAWACDPDDGSGASVTSLRGLSGALNLVGTANEIDVSDDTIDTITVGLPSAVTIDTLTLTNDLTVANGGTGASTFTSNGLIYGNGAGALLVTAAGTPGQVLVANGSNVPTFVSFSGDVVVDATGTTTIQADSVALGTDTTGNYVATITNGNGISGSSASEGGTPTIALGNLTANWQQTGAFDIVL
ncbi:MAG TPA: hypothetical protein VGA08_01790, partial [Candidatus Saccharimonadales bacterium]